MGVGVMHSQQRAAEGSPVRAHTDAWDDAWEKAWLRDHAYATAATIDEAHARGLITDAQREAGHYALLLADHGALDETIRADVAATLTVDEALAIIDRRTRR